MDTKKLEILVKTVELKSMNKASEQLGYTQSGLAYLINTLEDDLGLQLLERKRSGVSYTAEGQALLPYIQELLNAQKSFDHKISQLKGKNENALRIGTVDSIAHGWLADLLFKFKESQKDLRIDLKVGVPDVTLWLENDEIDFAVIEERYAENFEWQFLANDYMYLAVPRSSDLARRDFVSLEDLSKLPSVYSSRNVKNAVLVAMEAQNLEFRNNISVNTISGSILLQMVSSNFGPTYLSGLYLSACPANVKMIPIYPPVTRPLGLIAKSIRGLSPTSKTFIRLLKEKIRSLPDPFENINP